MSNEVIEVTADNVLNVAKRGAADSDVFLIKASDVPHALMIATWLLRSRKKIHVRFEGVRGAEFSDVGKKIALGIETTCNEETGTYALRFKNK